MYFLNKYEVLVLQAITSAVGIYLLRSGTCPVTCCPITLPLLDATGAEKREHIQSWSDYVHPESQSNNLLPWQCWTVTHSYSSTEPKIRKVLISSLLSCEVLLDISNMNWSDSNKGDFHITLLLLFRIAYLLNAHL